MLLAILIVMSQAFAQNRSNLYTKPVEVIEASAIVESSTKSNGKKKHNTSIVSGNLDHEILVATPKFRSSESGTIVAANLKQSFDGLRAGDVLQAEIIESAIAFPDMKAPIRARVSRGQLKGAILLGEATLERNTKRILIDFRMFRPPRGQDDYKLQASVLDTSGILGLEGKYNSKEAKYFGAEFLAAVAAGVADASIERSQNVLGNYVEKPGGDTIAKKAAASALTKTADVFAERIKTAPEYSILDGPAYIQILIHAQPILDI